MTRLYQLCERLKANAIRQGAWLAATSSGWFATQSGWRFELVKPREGHAFHLNTIHPSHTKLGDRWRIDPSGSTTPDGTKQSIIPQEIVRALMWAQPTPPIDSLYGIREAGKIIVLVWMWKAPAEYADHDYPLASPFSLVGKPLPSIYRRAGIPQLLDLEQWWAGVNAGRIQLLNSIIDRSRNPVQVGYDGEKIALYILTNNGWTGIGGPALYRSPDGQHITLDEAQRRGGKDIRRDFR